MSDDRTSATYRGTTYRNGRMPANLLAPLEGRHGTSGKLTAELRVDAAAAYNRARAEAAAVGETLTLRGWYRSLDEQQTFYDRPHDQAVAVPGYSNHGLGLAVDVMNVGGVGDFDNARRRKLAPILERNGFTDTEGRSSNVNEPWHFVYDPAADRGADSKGELDMNEAQLKAALTEWAGSPAGKAAICDAVWKTDRLEAPADTDTKKNPTWSGVGFLRSIRTTAQRAKKG